MARSSGIIHRASHVIRTAGVKAFVREGVRYCLHGLGEYGHYYLYRQDMQDWDEAAFLPRLPDIRCEIVVDPQRSQVAFPEYLGISRVESGRKFAQGCIAVCLFAGEKMVHISWLALSQAAKETFDWLPYTVDYAQHEACNGATVTDPRYRQQHLMEYASYKKYEYLKSRGITCVRRAVSTRNIASQKGGARFGQVLYARARYFRLFGYKSWKETPVT